jgi:preprotein translocase subunit Sec63
LNPQIFYDACEILGIRQDASLKEAKLAYRRLSSVYHPDNAANLSEKRQKAFTEEMQIINQAWKTVERKLK